MHKKILIYLLISLGGVFGVLFLLLFSLYMTLPDVKLLEGWTPPQSSIVYDYRDRPYGDIGVQKRYYVKIDEIPDRVIYAFVAAEDRNFFSHSGIDFGAVFRAMIANLKAGRVVQGGSTITQQLAKNLFLTRERTLKRKLKEALLAIKIERTFDKRKILELYLNQIYLGNGAYGVEAAARVYFGKSVKDLTLEEAALLGGLPKAPSRFNPFVNPDTAKTRRNYVLKRMLEDGYITQEEYETAVNKPIVVRKDDKYRLSDYVLDMVKEYLTDKYGDIALQGGLKIYTTIDRDLQALAIRSLKQGLKNTANINGLPIMPETEEDMEEFYKAEKKTLVNGKVYVAKIIDIKNDSAEVELGKNRFKVSLKGLNLEGREYLLVRLFKYDEGWQAEVVPDLQGALISMDVHTGAIRAIVGGYSYAYSPFNRAIKAKRQPGSAIKPVIYLSALLKGETQISSIDARARTFYDPATGKEWTPKNYEDSEYTVVTLREALAKSINTATVNLLDKLGFEIVLSVGDKVGLSNLKPYYSLALGTFEVTPLQLTSAYQVFANLGKKCEPFFIRRIVDENGNVLEENTHKCEEVLPPQETRVLVDMLRAVILEGTGRAARDLPRVVAGKTGTTDEYMDAWFIGFSPYIVTGVWVGYDIKVSLGEKMSGARVALPIWKNFMAVAASKYPNDDFPLPEGTVVVPINPKDYVIADETCPGVNMVFVEGTQPKLTCSDLRNIISP
ncbi:penicillin-binding protein 1A [Hydrogenivirga caldilitoris]|uniref:Penicillin-binding protein 1A n=1 Tax=Hydrogenivirga caldilitoris TaxID=246264 RepID=A0A497XNJ8_9AQUI|nr:PBP1A family penicillin-binding protein [Hydrogenivirga caldilitoris]RLJ69831.1 penicillin-binding protein 1A [Hydrogenivirga caldilitoris]